MLASLKSVAATAAMSCLLAMPAVAQEKVVHLAPGSPEHGANLIVEKGCGSCHIIPGITGADGLVGPPLIMMSKRIYVAGILRNTPQNLAAWVLDPQHFVPGNAMPSTGLTQAEAIDVAAYLETLK